MSQMWRIYKYLSSLLLAQVYTAHKMLSLKFGVQCSNNTTSRSWGFKSLPVAEHKLFQNCACKIGNGLSIKTFAQSCLIELFPLANSSLPLALMRKSRILYIGRGMYSASSLPNQTTPFFPLILSVVASTNLQKVCKILWHV